MTGAGQRRCAIYTRVSSDGGLEQEFNSLHAQREAAEAYIKSQAHEGWRLRRDRYDDGGFSGGSMERPALKHLLADVADHRIDVIVVYKVDRLTRSLADFAKLVELFDRHGVSFVSVTQSFNTTSSMGRLTLNVLLSFAQFEREVTGERIRDKIAASKKKGLWMGGTVPLGYRVEARKLLVDDAEADTVRLVFERYLALGSLAAVQEDLRRSAIVTRVRSLSSGRTIGGISLTNGPLSHMLRNRIYLGEINHKGQSFPGEHEPIIDPDLFAAVQEQLGGNAKRSAVSVNGQSSALLLGRIFDDRGHPMSPSHTLKGKIRYRYYVSSALVQGRKAEAGSIARVPALLVESTVVQALMKNGVVEVESGSTNTAITPDLLTALDLRVEVHSSTLRIHRNIGPIRQDCGTDRYEPPRYEGMTIFDPDADVERQTLTIPFDPQPRKRQREILLPDTQGTDYIRPLRQKEQQNLIRSIALAKSWVREIMNGAAVGTIASQEDKTERAIRMNLSLAFLDPKLVKAVMHGTLPRGVSARRLVDAPTTWALQWQRIGLSRPG